VVSPTMFKLTAAEIVPPVIATTSAAWVAMLPRPRLLRAFRAVVTPAAPASINLPSSRDHRGHGADMLDRRGFLLGGVILAASRVPSASSAAISLDPERWQIGPVIRGKNYSPGMPSQPTAEGSGWSLTFPAQRWSPLRYTPLSGSLMGRGEVKIQFPSQGPDAWCPLRRPAGPGALPAAVGRRLVGGSVTSCWWQVSMNRPHYSLD
jgi:hypothetical protein